MAGAALPPWGAGMLQRTRVLLSTLALIAIATTSAAEGVGVSKPPPPRGDSGEHTRAWVKQNIVEGDYYYVGFTDEMATLVNRPSIRLTPSSTVRFWAKNEYFRPDLTGSTPVRSAHVLYEADCDADRFKILAVDEYAYNNLFGEVTDRIDKPTDWMYNRPETLGEELLSVVCRYVRAVLNEAAEEQTRDVRDRF